MQQTIVFMGDSPIGEVHWLKALNYLMDGKASLVKTYEQRVYQVNKDIYDSNPKRYGHLAKYFFEDTDPVTGSKILYLKMPAVVSLLRWLGFKKKKPPVSREAVFTRDNFECQYEDCRTTLKNLKRYGTTILPRKVLTIDHVKPQCQGGKHEWTNVVTACFDCNSRKKGGYTPEQVGMVLKTVPKEPSWLALFLRKHKVDDLDQLYA